MHILSISDFASREAIEDVIRNSEEMIPWAKRRTYSEQINMKAKLGFFEPSTRTLGSTRQAAKNLGLDIDITSGEEATALMKKESLADTCRMFAGQDSDIIVLRTRLEGGPRFVAEILQESGYKVTVINAGDGTNQHPTQTFLDLLTIKQFLGRLDNFTIGIVGDLKLGRTAHSLIQALSHFDNIKVVLVSPPGMEMPEQYKTGVNIIKESHSLSALYRCRCDACYITRLQLERIKDPVEKQRVRVFYVIDKAFLDKCKSKVIFMHPLPCVNEIAPNIKRDSRFIGYRQAWFGKPSRMFHLLQACREEPYLDLSKPKENLIISQEERKARTYRGKVKYFQPIGNGTVIDHIPAGHAELVKRILYQKECIPRDVPIITAESVHSKKYPNKLKDVVIIVGGFIPVDVAGTLSLAVHGATFNVLRGNGRQIKIKYRPPSVIDQVFKCPNENCITNNDPEAQTRFNIIGRRKSSLVKCHYCEKQFTKAEIVGL